MRARSEDLAVFRSAIRASFDSTVAFTAAGRGAGPAPTVQRAPLHERPRSGRYGAPCAARSRVQAPRRTYWGGAPD
ncbi:hypothetical protein [Streptomyces sp. NPDC001809]